MTFPWQISAKNFYRKVQINHISARQRCEKPRSASAIQIGTTNLCEVMFSSMVHVKSKYRNRLYNSHLKRLRFVL